MNTLLNFPCNPFEKHSSKAGTANIIKNFNSSRISLLEYAAESMEGTESGMVSSGLCSTVETQREFYCPSPVQT